MNHPDQDAWIPYLYGEASAEDRQRLETHLGRCAACRELVDGWQSTLGRLDRWTLPPARGGSRVRPPWANVLRWAAVIVVSAVVGAIAGRWSGSGPVPIPGQPAPNAVVATGPKAEAEASARTTLATLAAVEDLRRENEARYLALRRDLETLAATTDAALRQTHRGLYHLASQHLPESP